MKSLDLVIPSFPAQPKRKCLHSVPTQTLHRPGLAVIKLNNEGPAAIEWPRHWPGGQATGAWLLTDKLACDPGRVPTPPWASFLGRKGKDCPAGLQDPSKAPK